MKKILMAAVAVTALTAGSASALTINTTITPSAGAGSAQVVGGTKIGNQFITPTALQATAGMKSDPVTIASETLLTTQSTLSAVIRLNTTESLPAGARYVVTYRITGGTFVTDSVASTDLAVQGSSSAVNAIVRLQTAYLDAYYASLGGAYSLAYATGANRIAIDAAVATDLASATPATVTTAQTRVATATGLGYAAGNFSIPNGASVSTGSVTPTAVQFVFQAGTAPTTGITWTSQGIVPSADKSGVSITAEVSTEANQALLIDGGATASLPVVDFRTGLAFKATAAAQTLSIASGFKKFGTAAATAAADTTSAAVGTDIGFALAGPAITGDSGDGVFKIASGTATAIATTDVTAASLTVGGSLAAFDARVGTSTTAQLADVTTGSTGALNPTNLGALQGKTAKITLQQKATPVVGSEVTYTVKPTDVVLSTGLLAGTYSAKTIGKVSFEGVNFYGAWLTDGAGASGFKNTIRLGNKSVADITSVKVSLINPYVPGTSGTVASTATCEVGPLKASSELLVTSAKLYTCFGAFGRSDVQITIQGNKSDLSAKMRLTSPDGSAADTTLGSGTADASDNYVN